MPPPLLNLRLAFTSNLYNLLSCVNQAYEAGLVDEKGSVNSIGLDLCYTVGMMLDIIWFFLDVNLNI